MEFTPKIFFASIPLLAITLTLLKTPGEKLPIRALKLFGILISSMPIIGIIQGYMTKKRLPLYAQACFFQAAFCGLGFLIVAKILPNYL